MIHPSAKRLSPESSQRSGLSTAQIAHYEIRKAQSKQLVRWESPHLPKEERSLMQLRKQKRLTDCLEILASSGIEGDEAIFVLSNLGVSAIPKTSQNQISTRRNTLS